MPKIIKSVSVNHTPVVVVNNRRMTIEEEEEVVNEPADTSLLVKEAEQEAKTIIDSAQMQAAACITEANELATTLQQQAQQSGYDEGYQRGSTDGEQAALAQMKQHIEDAVVTAQRILSTAEQQAQAIVIGAEREIVEIALAIARTILVREVSENPMTVLPIVRAALDKIRDQDQINIRVHPEDYELVLQARRDLQMIVGKEQAIRITADQTVSAGGCVIDTAYGSVDAQIDTQLEVVRKALEELLP